jgi:hypothetical protein
MTHSRSVTKSNRKPVPVVPIKKPVWWPEPEPGIVVALAPDAAAVMPVSDTAQRPGDVPRWVVVTVANWLRRFGMDAWVVTCEMTDVVDPEKPGTRATTQLQPDIRAAHIIFRQDLADNPDWRCTVIHEVLHIVLASLDCYVADRVISKLPHDAQALADETFTDELERVVHSLAVTYYKVAERLDYPAEYAAKDRQAARFKAASAPKAQARQSQEAEACQEVSGKGEAQCHSQVIQPQKR